MGADVPGSGSRSLERVVVQWPSTQTTSASVLTRWIASTMSSVPSKNRVTSSIPSMNTKLRTLENWFEIAYTRCSVNRANAATEPEMSAITKISGFAGLGYLNLGSAGTPP